MIRGFRRASGTRWFDVDSDPALKRRAIVRRSLRDLRLWQSPRIDKRNKHSKEIPEGSLIIARQFTGGIAPQPSTAPRSTPECRGGLCQGTTSVVPKKPDVESTRRRGATTETPCPRRATEHDQARAVAIKAREISGA